MVALTGVKIPFVNAFSAVVLILSGLFLIGTIVYARRQAAAGETTAAG